MWKSLKRWPVLLALLVALGALAVGLVCLPHGSRVTRANFERIQKGMTEAEVRAILGKPWDDSLLDPDEPSFEWVLVPVNGRLQQAYERYWMGDNFGLLVAFDDDSRVAFAVFFTPNRPPSSLPERIWRRLRARYG